MADMESHGRHRHRASKRASAEASAAGRGAARPASGSGDWFAPPEWTVVPATANVAGRPGARSDVDRSRSQQDGRLVDRAYRVATPSGARPGQGWEGTLPGRGGLAELGFSGPVPGAPVDSTPDPPEHWVPQPRHTPERQPAPARVGTRQAGRSVPGRHAAAAGRRGPREFDPTQFGGGRRPPKSGSTDARTPVRRSVKVAIYGTVLAGLVGGAGAWASLDKSVTLSVDGEVHGMHTYAGTVRGALDDAGVQVGDHDLLAPGPDARIGDGSEIVLRHGRLLRLTVDGQTRTVWVTATSVDEALDQIGYRQSGLYLSASRSRRLPLDGFSLEIRTPKTVTVIADGHTRRIVTTAISVGEMLEQSSLRVGPTDRVSSLVAAPVVDGMRITVTRVGYRRVVTRTVVAFKEIEKQDPTLSQGTRKVITEGVNGLREVTHVVTYLDGKPASSRVASVRVLTKTVDQVVLVGTRPTQAGTLPTYGGLNWSGLAQCESGGNPRAINPAGPYYGLYQFDLGTWQSNGGTGLPIDASPTEQTRVAYNLYLARGREPWPVCGKYL